MTVLVRALDPPWKADAGGGGKGANAKYELQPIDSIAAAVRLSPAWSDAAPSVLAFMWATVGALHTGAVHGLCNLLHLTPCAGFVWIKANPVTRIRICAEANDAGLLRARVSDLEATLAAVRRTAATGDADAALRIMQTVDAAVRFRPTAEPSEADVVGEELYRPQAPGIGQWTRCAHEHLIICRRGTVAVPLPADRTRSTIFAPTEDHSVKPNKAWEVIEKTARSSLRLAPGEAVDAVEIFARARRPGWGAWGRLNGDKSPAVFVPAPFGERWNAP